MATKPLLTILLLGVAGCATSDTARTEPTAVPTPGPTPSSAPSASAVVTEAGVRLEVRTDIPHPRELDSSVLPLFVRIRNDSARNVVVRPQAFHLVSAAGDRRQAISPERRGLPGEPPLAAEIAMAFAGLRDDVLRPAGMTEGFLYFEPFETTAPVGLTFDLWAQHGTDHLGLLTIPLITLPNR